MLSGLTVGIKARFSYLFSSFYGLRWSLRALRKANGWTQAQLGQRLSLEQTHISKIEKDLTSISVAQLFDVLTALGVRVSLAPTAIDDLKGARHSQPDIGSVDW